jgi:hypothetical protein
MDGIPGSSSKVGHVPTRKRYEPERILAPSEQPACSAAGPSKKQRNRDPYPVAHLAATAAEARARGEGDPGSREDLKPDVSLVKLEADDGVEQGVKATKQLRSYRNARVQPGSEVDREEMETRRMGVSSANHTGLLESAGQCEASSSKGSIATSTSTHVKQEIIASHPRPTSSCTSSLPSISMMRTIPDLVTSTSKHASTSTGSELRSNAKGKGKAKRIKLEGQIQEKRAGR